MKELKDYLHLYLGCKCETVKGVEYITGHIIDLVDGNYYTAKPILRPLSDMTEEEKIDIEGQYKSFIKSTVYNDSGVVMWAARHTQILLSKHFDLFGLIESGLAIDKTNVTVK